MHQVTTASRGTKGVVNRQGTVLHPEPVYLERSNARAPRIPACSLLYFDSRWGRRVFAGPDAHKVFRCQMPSSVISHGNAAAGLLWCA